MKLVYKPAYTDGYSKISGQDVAMLICLPDNYNGASKWPVKIFCHGMGQRGPGTKGALDTVFAGPYQAIPEDWKTNVDKLGIIGVLVNYNDFFQPASWRFVDQYLRNNYNVVDKFMRQGFSWGGGSLNRAIQQADIAAATAVAILVAPTVEPGDTNWKVPAKSGSVIWVHVNTGDPDNPASKGDDVVGKGPAISIVNGINGNTPVIPATLTGYKEEGHGGTNHAVGAMPPLAPEGVGLTNAGESADQLYLRVQAGDVSAPKSRIPTQPVPPIVTPPATKPVAIASYTGTIPRIKLDGMKSTCFKSATWGATTRPDDVSPYANIIVGGAGWITAEALLPAKGYYEFTLTLTHENGNVATAVVPVTYGEVTEPVVKVPASFAAGKLTFTDNTSEAATAVFTTASGKTYKA